MPKTTRPIPKLDGPYQVVAVDGGPLGPSHDVTFNGKSTGGLYGGGSDGGRGSAVFNASERNAAFKAGAADAEERLRLLREEIRMIADGLESDLRLTEDSSFPKSRRPRIDALRAAIARSEHARP